MDKDKIQVSAGQSIGLGDQVKDIVTGFKGTATGLCGYITGCDQLLVTPPVDKEGKHVGAKWFDVNRIDPAEGEKITLETDEHKGAMDSAPTQ